MDGPGYGGVREFAGRALGRLWGQRLDIALPNPAEGADWRYQLTGGYQYRVLLCTWLYTRGSQSAKAGPTFAVYDGDGNLRMQTPDTGELGSGSAAQISVVSGITTSSGVSNAVWGIEAPDVLLDAGWSIGSLTTNLQTKDQISGVRLLIEQLMSGDPGRAYGLRPHDHQPERMAHGDA